MSEDDRSQICGMAGRSSFDDFQIYMSGRKLGLEVIGQAQCHIGNLVENRRAVGVFHKAVLDNPSPRDIVKNTTVYLLENGHRDVFVDLVRGKNSSYVNIFEEITDYHSSTIENRLGPLERTGRALCRRIQRYEVHELYDLHVQHCTSDGIFEQ